MGAARDDGGDLEVARGLVLDREDVRDRAAADRGGSEIGVVGEIRGEIAIRDRDALALDVDMGLRRPGGGSGKYRRSGK